MKLPVLGNVNAIVYYETGGYFTVDFSQSSPYLRRRSYLTIMFTPHLKGDSVTASLLLVRFGGSGEVASLVTVVDLADRVQPVGVCRMQD